MCKEYKTEHEARAPGALKLTSDENVSPKRADFLNLFSYDFQNYLLIVFKIVFKIYYSIDVRYAIFLKNL